MYEPANKMARDGRSYRGKKLTDEAARYRDDAILIIQAARPSHWAPQGQIRVYWAFYLTHNLDCDNAMKVVHDAIQRATGINDSRYLPCVMDKVYGVSMMNARVEIVIDEAQGSLWSDLDRWRPTPTP